MNSSTVEILLVEDNISDAELTIRELKRHHMANNLVHVKDGEEALEFIFGTGRYTGQRENFLLPKVVLLDIQMPKVNGMEVLQQLKQNPLTQSMPVVILTSSKESPDIKRCYELGANSYIVKPVNFERFAEAIRNLGFYWLLLNQSPSQKL
ncbi:MAG: response regulator [Chitinophagales bacterium]|nr:response regulator [Chitinophagales bacterium]